MWSGSARVCCAVHWPRSSPLGKATRLPADQLGHARVSVIARHYIDTHGVVRDAGPSAFAAFIDSDTDTAE